MKQKPQKPEEPLINKKNWKSIFTYALALTVSVFAIFLFCHNYKRYDDDLCNNIAFFSLAFAQLLHPLNLASSKESFFKNEITGNPHLWIAVAFCTALILGVYFIYPFNSILSLQQLTGEMWLLIIIGSSFHLVIIQFLKRLNFVE